MRIKQIIVILLFGFLLVVSRFSSYPRQINSSPSPVVIAESTASAYLQKEEFIKVVRTIDGDTIEIEGGQRIRYIGIDAPELHDPRQPVGCFAQEAYEKNKELVEGKVVRMQKDISETDKYGRLLRYIWVEDLFLNDYLVRQGYAQVSSYPPDVLYQEQFQEAERNAQQEGKGLWGSCYNR